MMTAPAKPANMPKHFLTPRRSPRNSIASNEIISGATWKVAAAWPWSINLREKKKQIVVPNNVPDLRS